MEEKDDNVIVFPYQRGEFLSAINLFESLKKFRAQYTTICQMVTETEEAMKSWHSPRNPREDLIQVHEKKSLQVWKKQKERLEQKIAMIEQQIQQAIENQGRK